MIDFAALQEFVYEDRVYDSNIHGLAHWRQVEFNGLLLAKKTKADVTVVRLFALFHDSKRESDGYDSKHGGRGAEFALKCREEKLFEITDEQFEKLYHACKHHTTERSSGDPTIDTCYDADRLDLGRVDFLLDPQKMATSAGALIATKSRKENVPTQKMRDWLLRFEF
ncbi:uncharacterized protein SAMN05720766_104159 [Fibrobacter sp. UWH9]|uniref:hypothetical protein n=1 Tax=Fibrobacter sp. UWH9 TaxID=1896213 RepID=UPI000923104E|nr:hypothetical protein [Fibrobacter sp. UWH9]MCQ2099509.1 hypothetical protein [Fibrobacter sp.]MDO4946946.1 hypothetical protein [Fibrobacter sp.]SHG81021.1 uncharacterized protein SAMN05720766_104159 [Fibrobacter sp. UWH9]